jgi:hypothetical protein
MGNALGCLVITKEMADKLNFQASIRSELSLLENDELPRMRAGGISRNEMTVSSWSLFWDRAFARPDAARPFTWGMRQWTTRADGAV